MGACLNNNKYEEINRNKSKCNDNKFEYNIILLGLNDCGKTTILKQVKKMIMQHRMIDYMTTICKESLKLLVQIEKENNEYREWFVNKSYESGELELRYNYNYNEICVKMHSLWNDNGIQLTLKTLRRNRYEYKMDNIEYFMKYKIDDIMSNDYIMTNDDEINIKHIDQTTKDIVYGYIRQSHNENDNIMNMPDLINHICIKYYLMIKSYSENNGFEIATFEKMINSSKYYFIFHTDIDNDILKLEKYKTMEIPYDRKTALVFIVEISDIYNSKLQQTLDLFTALIQNVSIHPSKITILFNKYDLFLNKLNDPQTKTIRDGIYSNHFPDDKDERNPYHVVEFIYHQFTEIYKNIHYHGTTALDTEQIHCILQDIMSDLPRNTGPHSGF